MTSTNSTTDAKSAGSGMALPARIFLAFLILAGVVQLLFEHSHDSITLLPCPFHSITGVQCPGCGMTRACLAASKGEFGAAWFYHPFVYLLIGGALLAALAPQYTEPFRKRFDQRQRRLVTLILLAAVLLFWIYRLASGWVV